ncbi:PAS domain-containing protein [Paraburkholderia phytofirmans]|uniref:PAS domain-containing protein n=1 Tax=Paraburkholderia sp. BL9I2N2 TaxID=1938809 RepID=UPI00104CFEC5|nr:PAS domain-containing protein [Paraburkholderia sp. BL9I2N2]
MRISRFSRIAALAIGVSIASGTVSLLESYTGCLGLVLVILFTHLLGRNIGRLSAAFVSSGIVWVLVGLPHPVLASSSFTRSIITIPAAWLCVELVSRRSRKPASTARMKDAPFDLPIENLASQLWSRTIDGQLEYVNDRKIAESRLRSEGQNYRRMVDRVPACVCVADPAGKLVYVNKVVLAALGRPSEEVVGDLWMNYIHPAEVEAVRTEWAQCIETGQPVDVVVRMQQYDGVYRWQHLVAEPFYDEGVVVNWYLVGIEVDDAIKAQEALQKSEKEARELLDRLPGRFATRTTTDFDFVNRHILEETGTTLEELQKLGFLHFIHPDDKERIRQAYLRSVEQMTAYEDTYRWKHADGEYRWHHSRSVPYFNEDGSVYKWYAMNLDIDDLYKTKEVIREREAQLNWLTDAVPGFLWSADAAGSVEYVSKQAEAYTGRSLHELTSNGWLDLVHPDDYATVIETWDQSMKSGAAYDTVHRLRAADGSYRWFQCRANPMRNARGDITKWYGLLTDIHERKIAEERLRRKELHLRRLVDAMPAMIWRATPGGDTDRWNRRMLSFIGKTWEEIGEEPLFSLVPPDQRERVHRHWQQCVLEGSSYQDTYQITGADGKLHWYLVRGEPFRDETGEILHWYGVCTDIEDLKETEVALQQREHQLREITETIPAMIWCADADGQLTYANRRFTEYAGWDTPEVCDLEYRKSIHPDDWEGLIQKRTHSVQTSEPYAYAHRKRHKDGQYRWHLARAEAMRDADGNIVQWYGLTIDIDEQKRTEDTLREVQTQLTRATRIATVAEISASIAHELNQPLTSVIVNAHACRRWLEANPPNLDKARSSVEGILRDGRAADETMQSIRTLFKRESFKKSQCNIPCMVRDAVRLLKEDPSMRDAAITPEFPDNLPDANVDQIQIQQVLINLISNAIEATENTGRTPKVGITGAVLDELFVTVEISDNGEGVAELETLFEPFVTSKAKGMGIGLAISRSIIEAHDGTLTARNNLDQGATFSLTLPIFARSGEPQTVAPAA